VEAVEEAVEEETRSTGLDCAIVGMKWLIVKESTR
jgi:hypothetical protein